MTMSRPMRQDLFLDHAVITHNHDGEGICGDFYAAFDSGQHPVFVLSDGMGSGVKANLMATLTDCSSTDFPWQNASTPSPRPCLSVKNAAWPTPPSPPRRSATTNFFSSNTAIPHASSCAAAKSCQRAHTCASSATKRSTSAPSASSPTTFCS